MSEPQDGRINHASRGRKRRGRGEGSISQRRDGLWMAIVTVGYDQNGRRKRRYLYAPTKSEVQAKLTDTQTAARAGTLIDPSRETVGAYLRRWLETASRPKVRPSTFARYEDLVRVHIMPALGGVPMSKLHPQQVQALYSEMEKAGQSGRSREQAHAVLHKALKQALKWGLVVRNVCEAVERPRPGRREMQTWTVEEARTFLSAAGGDRFRAAYVLALTTGMREGELLGLQWPDVDLDTGALSVRRTVQDVRGQIIVGEPKSAKSRRRIDLPAIAVAALRQHRKMLLAMGLAASAWVFPNTIRPSSTQPREDAGPTNADGPALARRPQAGPTRPSKLVSAFKALRNSVVLPDGRPLPLIRFHDLRHTSATLQLLQGIHPKIVQERLGHSTITLTLDTYSHVLPGMQKPADDAMDRAFGDISVDDWLQSGGSGPVASPRRR